MGYNVKEFIIGVTDDRKTAEMAILKSFVRKNPELFAQSPKLVNGYVTYVMYWDGSKEGWQESDDADVLRAKFIELLKKAGAYHIYHLRDPEDDKPRVKELMTGEDAIEYEKKHRNEYADE